MKKSKLTIPKVWRSELTVLCGYLIACGLSIFLSRRYPQFLITGTAIELGSMKVTLSLPLFWLMPLFVLFIGILRIYDVKYIIDSRGLEARVGILRLNQRIIRVLYNDIRSAETEQSVIGRVLNVGDVEIGTAATAEVEVVFRGVAAPQELQQIIQRERDRSLQINS